MSQTVVITGASRGIGLALTRLYLERGDTVHAVCREVTPELRETGAQIIDRVDVTEDTDIARLAAALKGVSIDLLINNAGIFLNETLEHLDIESISEQLAVNAVAPLHVTAALLGNLGKGSRIGLITSRMGSIADNGSGKYYGYRMSKAALNAAGKSLAVDMKPRGISVAILHPGMVSTRMVNFAGDMTPEQSAAGLAARLDELTLENSGRFWHANGQELPW